MARTETRMLEAGGEQLDFSLRYSRRRTLAIYVHADTRIEVRAPLDCAPADAEHFLRTRLQWVRRKQAEFAQRRRPPPGYTEGECHPFLGARYPLRLEQAARPRVALVADEIRLAAPDVALPERVALRLAHWYRGEAERLYPARLGLCFEQFKGRGVTMPELKLRQMKSRWGSCSRRGSITINVELMKFPLECIDYVIYHELCHLIEFNHSPRFYALMDAVMPHWRGCRAQLKAGMGGGPD